MNDPNWIGAAIAAAAGIVVGSILARIVRGVLSRERRPEPVREAAGAIASLFFAAAVIVGLITALGFVDDAAVDDLPNDFIDYVPRALSAAIVLIVANIAATFIVAALERSLGHVSPAVRRRVPPTVRGAILFMGALIAANQLGVDTQILTIAAAALFFGIALTVALVAYSGSGPVASEVAASRALRRVLAVGDAVDTEAATGTIVELHTVKAEIETADGRRVLVPYTALLDAVIGITRADP
ncbi:MAG: mechanosensitive ion channel family protein [Acidimicrobiales bacterium]|nr:mechanosensitive ion channel family protein [Acidimicrobiales bacterium]